jgi:predicted RNA-binding Zn-ribbon protein involved in translation (DUF1610 family)
MEQTTEIKCPKCGSNQITANKKGFSGGKALVGGVLTGGVGLLAGTIGSKKIIITCLSCGYEFKPGESNKPVSKTVKMSFKERVNEQYEIKNSNSKSQKVKSEKKPKTKKYWQIIQVTIIILAIIFFLDSMTFAKTREWGFVITFLVIDCILIFGAINANKKIKELKEVEENSKSD